MMAIKWYFVLRQKLISYEKAKCFYHIVIICMNAYIYIYIHIPVFAAEKKKNLMRVYVSRTS